MQSDYEIVQRTTDQSGKYLWATYTQPGVDIDKAIVVSHADMQYKFSPDIYNKFLQKVGQPHFGYTLPTKQFKQALINWIQTRYHPSNPIKQQNLCYWNNTVCALHGIIENTTAKDDQVLIIAPTYYLFFHMVHSMNRQCVEYVLETKGNRFYIDFDKLQEVIKNNKIKLMIFCNPWNPCGRIWAKQELAQLAQLVSKYKFYIISDEIYSESIELTPQQQQNQVKIEDIFTSMLTFPQIYQHLIYVSSYSKAYNAAALGLGYTICFNEQLNKRLYGYMAISGAYPNALSATLLEVIYTSDQAKKWIRNTSEYLRNNYKLFVKECGEKLPKLKIYDLQCSYLCLVDFEEYNLAGDKLKQRFTKVNVCPTFMEPSFKTQQPRSLIRLNLAIHETLIVEMVDRMKKMVQQPN